MRVTSFEYAQDLLLSRARSPVMVHSTATNLILLQSLLLMIIDCDTRGPDNFLNRDGVPKHTLVQVARKFGYELAKSQGQLKTNRVADPDVDSNANLVRRSWVCFIILSRWYAISAADATVLGPVEIGGREDAKLTGQTFNGTARELTPLRMYECLTD